MKKLSTKSLTILFIILATIQIANAQNSWTSKKDYGGNARFAAAGFYINNKAYIGTGQYGQSGTKDFWEYDISNSTWTQVADYKGGNREGAVGFSIGSKGYVGTGSTDPNTYNSTKDFYEYDPSNNSWTKKTNYPGGIIAFAVGFSIGSKGYVGTGEYINSVVTSTKDFYEYDPANDSWTQKADFGGTVRSSAVGFSIDNKGYIGTGGNNYYMNGAPTKDFWEYNPSTDKWTQKTDFPGSKRMGASGFSIGPKGFIGAGNDGSAYNPYSDLYEYTPSTNTWSTKKSSCPTACSFAVGFSSCTKGYFITGDDGSHSGNNYGNKNVMEYTPSVTPAAVIYASKTNICVGDKIKFLDSSTCLPTKWYWSFQGGTPDTSTLQNPPSISFNTAGTYTVKLTASNLKCTFVATETITVNALPIITISPLSPSICKNSSISLTASGANTYSWSPATGLNSNTGATVSASPQSSTKYTVTGTSSAGCISDTDVTVIVKPLPIIKANPMTAKICKNDTVSLIASGALYYSWSPSNGLITNNRDTVIANPNATTMYTVTGTDSNGCYNTASVNITVSPLPIVDAGKDVSFCAGDSANLKV